MPAWSKRSSAVPPRTTGATYDGRPSLGMEVRENLPDLELKEDGSFALTPLGRHEVIDLLNVWLCDP